tara:strand:- start:1321 stop:1752 length:432 start_codon:yes stop_codon:yes gene_type:complete
VKYIKMTFHYLEGNLEYAMLFDKKDKFDRWSTVLILDGDQIKNAKKLNLRVNQNDDKFDGKPYVSLKTMHKPKIYDEDSKPYEGASMLTSGTEGVVKITQKSYDNKFGKGITTYIDSVKLTKVVPWVPPTNDDFVESASDSEF